MVGTRAHPAAVSRPGRPVRMPGDHTAIGRRLADPSIRLAWLLVVTRLLHPDPSMVSRSQFVDHLRSHEVAADVTRVSRWESGQQLPSPRQLEVYEEVLGLPPWSLIALQSSLQHLAGRRPSLADLTSLMPPDRPSRAGAASDPAHELERLVAAALMPAAQDAGRSSDDNDSDSDREGESDRLSAVGWLRLADLMARYEAVYLDRRTWARLSRRLLCELTVSVGLDELQLYDAASLLSAHPVAGRHLAEAILEWLRDPAVQEPVGIIYTLTRSPSPAGVDLLSQLLGSSASHPLFGAAEVVVADMLSREEDLGSLDPARGDRLEQILSARLLESDARPGLGPLDLAIHLPHAAFVRVQNQVVDPALRARLTALSQDRLLVPEAVARQVARSMARDARAAVPGPVDLVPDPLLQRLLMEAMFGVSVSLRWQAGLTLALSPYAASIAESCVDLATRRGAVLALHAWRALHYIGGQHHSPRLVPAALAETRAGLRYAAIAAVARTRGPIGADAVDELVATFVRSGRDDARPAVVAALARHAPERLGDLATTSTHLGAVVQWWQDVAVG